jgi:acyl-CoA hydrolase
MTECLYPIIPDSFASTAQPGSLQSIDLSGAALSDGGKPIIALGSVTRKGESKIVPVIRSGAGIVTSRAHMHWLITEYGAVNLFGKNLRQRAYEIMRIAHPDHRERLEQEIIKRFGSNTYPVH